MTEAEWLSCTSLGAAERMLIVVKEAATARKTMLLAANWIREVHMSYGGPNSKDLADSIERVADHAIGDVDSPYFSNDWCSWALVAPLDEFTHQFAALLDALRIDTLRIASPEQREQVHQNIESRVSRLTSHVREQFGNPFRPVTFSPEWRTGTAVSLARQMYESRDFSAMPILADALQDAVCDDEDILAHCRSEGAHVRGCWVVDLVLGKE
jgi:hypothetical protein